MAGPERAPASLGALLAERLAAQEARGSVRVLGPAPRDGPATALDGAQVAAALDGILSYLSARADSRPAPVRGIVRRVREGGRLLAEAAIRVRGLHVSPERWHEAVSTVLWTDERTREGHPGLALPDAVARGHGGSLVARETGPGTVVAFRVPAG